jgi:hypothetical protein
MYRSTAKYEAQDQLNGRTHYCDDSALRFHHARITMCDTASNGLLFWLIESVALDMNNTQRGFRYVIFDVFGNVVSRVNLENSFKTTKQALKAKNEFLATFDAMAHTKQALIDQKKHVDREFSYLEQQLKQVA